MIPIQWVGRYISSCYMLSPQRRELRFGYVSSGLVLQSWKSLFFQKIILESPLDSKYLSPREKSVAFFNSLVSEENDCTCYKIQLRKTWNTSPCHHQTLSMLNMFLTQKAIAETPSVWSRPGSRSRLFSLCLCGIVCAGPSCWYPAARATIVWELHAGAGTPHIPCGEMDHLHDGRNDVDHSQSCHTCWGCHTASPLGSWFWSFFTSSRGVLRLPGDRGTKILST